jgi:lysozyme
MIAAVTFSQDCVDLVKISEGLRLIAYSDPGGVPTIGWGHTGPDVVLGAVWSLDYAEKALLDDLQTHCEQMLKVVKVPLTQGQCDALTDFTFNEGIGTLEKSTLLTLLNMGIYAAVPNELYRVNASDCSRHGYIFQGGVILAGLVKRRQAEIILWNKL